MKTLSVFCIGMAIFIPRYIQAADPPGILTHQGFLRTATAIHHGPGFFKFALVDSTGAVTYWSNDNSSVNGTEPSAAVESMVDQGSFSVPLGDTSFHSNMTNAVPDTVFGGHSDVRLRVWVSTEANGPFEQLSPDIRIASVGFALSAGLAQGVPAGAITNAMLGNGVVDSGNLADDAVSGAKIADGSVTGAKIANGTVTGEKIAGATIAKLTCGNNEVPIFDGSDWTCGLIGSQQLVTGSISGDVGCGEDGSQIFIPGHNISATLLADTTSYTLSSVPPGAHSVIYRKPDGSLASEQVNLTAGQNLTGVDFGMQSFYQDLDGDGYGDPGVPISACTAPSGFVANDLDCDDTNPSRNPSQPELCDAVDNNCNGQVDEGNPGGGPGQSTCGAGACQATGSVMCVNGELVDTCVPGDPISVNDATCDGIDDDCDDSIDEDAVCPAGQICINGACLSP